MIVQNQRDVPAKDVVMEDAENVRIQVLMGDNVAAPHFVMRRFTIGPGGHTPLHDHDWEHEVFVLDGRGALVDENGREIPLRPTDFAFVPAGEVHQFRNTGQEDFVFLCVIPVQ
ncbi:MAG TPA: cupin domain-containing protein [Thermoplasmatales archaeon]|nr:cupin domain-containing protein [Thermoplasmatales archaeon]